MERKLLDLARQEKALKTGGERDGAVQNAHARADEPRGGIEAVIDLIARLEEVNPRAVEVFRLRLFARLSGLLRVPERTIRRDWEYVWSYIRDAAAVSHKVGESD